MEYSFEVSCIDPSGLRGLRSPSSSDLRLWLLRSLASSSFRALTSALAFSSAVVGAARGTNLFAAEAVCQFPDAISARDRSVRWNVVADELAALVTLSVEDP